MLAVSVPLAPCPTANFAATGAYDSALSRLMPAPTSLLTRSATSVRAMPVSWEVLITEVVSSASCGLLATPALIAISRMIA
ncbi:hypothetical protein PSPTOT1_3424 [Pseudomonas syringae pv. tomato T1]|nr:hypothetical protein PSPTOT1_3424 [Pseudomonas syringae pv. tomato T1]